MSCESNPLVADCKGVLPNRKGYLLPKRLLKTRGTREIGLREKYIIALIGMLPRYRTPKSLCRLSDRN